MPQPLNSFELIRLKKNKFQLKKTKLINSGSKLKIKDKKNYIYINPDFS
jgi:hypothetical protein